MSTLNRHDAGQLLDYALRLRLAGHAINHADTKKRFVRRAKNIEKRALLLLAADVQFKALPGFIASSAVSYEKQTA